MLHFLCVCSIYLCRAANLSFKQFDELTFNMIAENIFLVNMTYVVILKRDCDLYENIYIMIILDVIIFKLSQKQDKRFLNSSLDVNGHFVWNRLSAELQISKNKVTVINLSIFNRPFLTR